MAEAAPSDEFELDVLTQLEKLFKDDELETQVRRSELPGPLNPPDSAVRVKYLPSGKEATCDKYPSQIRNKICCLLTLLLDIPHP